MSQQNKVEKNPFPHFVSKERKKFNAISDIELKHRSENEFENILRQHQQKHININKRKRKVN